jgi:pyruvate ferredoxin oxidoreductase gamma subunit
MEESIKRYNVRMAGIGGQGVVTASHIISNGVVISGGFSSLVPFFGSEKRNAPVESYVRISSETIYEIGEIIFPNVIMIFHPSVITLGKSYTMPFYTGLKDGGVILINSKTPIPFTKDEQREMDANNAKIYYLPATEIANEVAKTELATNMAMCGAMAAIFGLPDLASLAASVKDRFIGKGIVVSGGTAALDSAIEKKFAKKAKLLEANMKTLQAAFKYIVDQGWAHPDALKEDLSVDLLKEVAAV